jgi:prolyl-tRNA editing enzyme YbaK/EbsC (Cys-tRNA(Pro) deacylase)
MEVAIMDNKEILINAGQRGVMLKMAPADIGAAIDCRVASFARDRQ